MQKAIDRIAKITEDAARETTVMPWTRGARRAAFIAKRAATAPAPLRAKA